MNKIYWDLDGVLRNVSKTYIGFIPPEWNYVNEKGKTITDLIEENPKLLATAKPLNYIKVALKFPFITILTVQRKSWIPYTEKWLEKYLSGISYDVQYLNSFNEKLDIVGSSGFLIDDCPVLNDYSRIILVEYQYNIHVKSRFRVKYLNELEFLLDYINRGMI